MANPNRKMATMRRIDEVIPIEGADRIEAYRVGGWVVVDGKGSHHEGDLVVYVEPDAFLPTDDKRYAFLRERGTKTMTVKKAPRVGHVLRTVKLRGQISQGIIFDPHDVLPDSVPEHAYEAMRERKARLDGIMGVCEYHPDQNSLAAGFIGKYDPWCGPRTDAERVQNIDQATFDLVKRCWYWTSVKVDGTSITLCNDPRHGRIRAFSHNNEFDLDSPGQGQLVMETARKQGLVGFVEAHPFLSLQMELCGPRVNGNPLRLMDYRLFVFSVWDTDNRVYVPPFRVGNITDGRFLRDLDQSLAPYADGDVGEEFLDRFDTPQDLIEWTSGMRGNVTRDALDEGLVVHVYDTSDLTSDETMALESALGPTMQMKSVSNGYLARKRG